MISVVIPLFNKEAAIAHTLNHVLQQTFGNMEVVVVDDGSTDASLAIAEGMAKADGRIKILSQQNQGVSAARNNGIRAARYRHIAFLDADDLWHPQYLEIMVQAIKQYPDAAIWGAGYQRAYRDNLPPMDSIKDIAQPIFIDKDVYFKTALADLVFWVSAFVVKKEVLEETGCFDPQLKVGEDLDFTFRILFKYDGVYVPHRLALYMRTDPNQLGPGKLVPLRANLTGRAYELYQRNIATDSPKYFRRFIYRYVLSNLLHYFGDGKSREEMDAILAQTPLRYKLSRPRFLLYALPWPLANFLYQKVRQTKG
ncbi:MAG: glycosyltransferase family 2 protein [Edaphocola sp.]